MATATKPTNGAGVPATQPERGVMEYIPFMADKAIKLSVSIVQNMICVPTKQGHRCDAAQAMKFMMLCEARKLNPFEGDAYLIGYDTKDGPQFSLITAHQAFLKRAEVHPEYDGMESGVIVLRPDGEMLNRLGDFTLDDDKLAGAWATVYFKNRSHPMKKSLRLSTFKKGFGRWMDDPAGMIVKCVEADALRASFPTMLGGMYLDDEMPSTIDVQSSPAAAPVSSLAQLTNRLASKPAKRVAEPDPDTTTYHHPEPVEVADEEPEADQDEILVELGAALDHAVEGGSLMAIDNAAKAAKEKTTIAATLKSIEEMVNGAVQEIKAKRGENSNKKA